MKLESFLRFATFQKTPIDAALSATFDHAWRKIQSLETNSSQRLRMQRTCKEREKLRRWVLHRNLGSGLARRLCSRFSDTDRVSDPMDFDNELLESLAHLDRAPTAPSTIITFLSVKPSVRSPPPAEDPSAVQVILMECILMPIIEIVMKSSVTRMEIQLTHLAWVLTTKSSWCLLHEVICFTWRPRYTSLHQLLHWLRKAFEPTRLC